MENLERKDIQGILLSSYSHLYWAFYVLLQVQEPAAARRGLAAIIDKVTTAEGKEEGCSVNVAFTQSGLLKLGLNFGALESFPIAFREGMSSDHRARILGDTAGSAPSAWAWGGPANSVDILLMLFAPDEAAVTAQLEKARLLIPANGVVEIATLAAERYPDNKEHFGFAGRGRKRTPEFILGYINEYGIPSDSPAVAAAEDPQRLLPEHASGA